MSMTAKEWNERYPVGTRVRHWPIAAREFRHRYVDTVTRSDAWELGCGIPVVKIVGEAGGVSIAPEHMEVLPDQRYMDPERRASYCQSDCDGDCTWEGCPQLRDNEPTTSGRHCPLDLDPPESEAAR